MVDRNQSGNVRLFEHRFDRLPYGIPKEPSLKASISKERFTRFSGLTLICTRGGHILRRRAPILIGNNKITNADGDS